MSIKPIHRNTAQIKSSGYTKPAGSPSGMIMNFRNTSSIPATSKACLIKSCPLSPINIHLSVEYLIISERSNPTLHACLPQKTPSASHGQARCSSNTAITQGEPSPEARRAFPLTQQKLSLDHDHATGEPRGLLHQQCNMKVAQIETHTKKLNYIISRLMLVELALQFRKKHYQLFYAVLSYIEGLLALRCLSWP